jgi:hypothetical protein
MGLSEKDEWACGVEELLRSILFEFIEDCLRLQGSSASVL